MNDPIESSTDIIEQPLATRAVRSGAWLYGRNIVTSLINLGVMAILARQLTPADFGLVALAQVLLRFLVILSEGGIGEFIISDNEVGRENRIQAAFWMNLTLSCAVLLVGLLAIPWIAQFYQEPDLKVVLIWLGVRYLISQVTLVPHSLVKKELRFNKLVIIDSVIEIASSITSVVLALAGWGVLSLVIPSVLLEPLRAAWFMYAATWMPKLSLRVAEWKGVFRYSSKIVISSLATTIGAEGDTLIIGRTLGSQSLGLYNMAWISANMIPRNLVSPVSGIALPAFSSIAQNRDRLKDALYRMVRIISVLSFPLIVGLFVIADLFILTIYGYQWTASIIPLRILLIYALRYVIGSPANSIFYSLRRPDVPMKFSLIFIPIYLMIVLVSSVYGINGVAIGVTLVRTSMGLVVLGVAARQVGSTLSTVIRQISSAMLASLCMGLIVLLARVGLGYFEFPNIIQLIILIGLGGVVYIGLLLFVFKDLLNELITLLDAFPHRLGKPVRRLLSHRS